MKQVAVIGAGAMGLATAYFLQQQGHQVTVFESDSIPGGMAAHFDFAGISIERFYHFVCKADRPLFDLLDQIGLGDALQWRDTSMGFYFNGTLYPWGDPFALLRFPGLGLIAKLRYGLHAFVATRRSDWSRLDGLQADRWLRTWLGAEAYRVCWEKLFHYKFFEYQERISAAWIWTRIKRIGTSRRSLFQEQLGYIEGGSETLIRRLVERIDDQGGTIHLGTPVQRIVIADGAVTGVLTHDGHQPFDAVISTIAIPYAAALLTDLPPALLARYQALPNIGVVCVVHKLRKPLTSHFWLNINDPRFEIPGVVEFSNLRPTGTDHIVYVPYYMPQTHPKFTWTDARFLDETRRYLQLLNPDLSANDFLAARVGRLRYAQPVCGPGFLKDLPPLTPGIAGLQVADTSYYYPEDRGIAEGVRLARAMADAVHD
ncbi:NAD(P)/FAD-dependent oxidoreductase [uncultured Thiodictyon sp.]|jgi:protoporphyrinogen oxidase|uniref:NAD(P)/FAD-dependent oxidoreductase n=1 Tax=uncultured Thiodictyon sp. TaxID=1846217 RepID=UPI0025E15FA9|nr:NAD(P)/FAD-dependent oxidoreductase [uncultured Thiodictyon sp.]